MNIMSGLPVSQIAQTIEAQGYAIVEHALTRDELAQYREALDALAEDEARAGDLYHVTAEGFE